MYSLQMLCSPLHWGLTLKDQDHEVSSKFSSHIPSEHSVTTVDATCGRCISVTLGDLERQTMLCYSLLSQDSFFTCRTSTLQFTLSLSPPLLWSHRQPNSTEVNRQTQGWGCGSGIGNLHLHGSVLHLQPSKTNQQNPEQIRNLTDAAPQLSASYTL